MVNTEGLVGIKYKEAVDDCWGLMRQFYKLNWNLELRDYARPPLWWVKNPELDITRNHFRDDGFQVVDVHVREMKPGDLVIMQISSKVLDHTAAYIGGGRILHHPFRALSRIDLYAGHWLDQTKIIARHPGIVHADKRPSVDLMDLLPKSKQDKYRAAGS